MITLPGLSQPFNRYLDLIDKTLPKLTRKEDPLAVVLYRLLETVKTIFPNKRELYDSLNRLFLACDELRAHQFQVEPASKHLDAGHAWLPLVLLGKEWRSYLHQILCRDFHHKLDRAKQIVCTPSGQNEPVSFSVTIHEQISDIDETHYDMFNRHIKLPFNRETSFDVDKGVITILDREKPFSSSVEDGELVFSGNLPKWLDILLDMNAVKNIEITYPVRKTDAVSFKHILRTVLIYPSCPCGWRTQKSAEVEKSISQIRNCLNTGHNAPFHIVLTAAEMEWYPVLERLIRDVIENSGNFFQVQSKNKETVPSPVIFLTLARYISLPHKAELRGNSEFKSLQLLFGRNGDDAIRVPIGRVATDVQHFKSSILERIGSLKYIDCVMRQFKEILKQVCDLYRSVQDDDTNDIFPIPDKDKRKSPELNENFTKVTRSLKITVQSAIETAIRIILNNLEVMMQSLASEAIKPGILSSLFSRSAEAKAEPLLVYEKTWHELLTQTVVSENRQSRQKALTAILYAMHRQQATNGAAQPDGIDEQMVVSQTVNAMKEATPFSDEVVQWAAGYEAKLDEVLDKDHQKKIEARLQMISGLVEGSA